MWYLLPPPTLATVTVYVVVVADLSTTIIFEDDCMATRVPSSETPRTRPKYSPVVEEVSEYTRAWPALVPVPSLYFAPIATRVPSEDIDTDHPDWSYAASPSISDST
tara:strand:+ start:584 stop:904 length:321 start_codon:yes stop_codon:yes gene_type:complete